MGTSHSFIEDLLLPAPISVDRYSLATQLVGRQIDFLHIIHRGLVREIDRLGNRVVRILLKSTLHPDVVFRKNIVGGHEEFSEIFRNLGEMIEMPVLSNLFHEMF